jgi:hypothetical protein
MIWKDIVSVSLLTALSLTAQNKIQKGGRCTVQSSVTAPVDVEREFIPSGWMGDGATDHARQDIQMAQVANAKSRPGAPNTVVTKITYRPGAVRWAGIYWQWPANNWGDKPAKAVQGASAISFWAAGERGGEIVEFKAGGVTGKPCNDSFEVSLGSVALTKDWKQYRIPLRNRTDSLKPIYGAFAWVATGDSNPEGLAFYLDSIRYE